jgi:tetratricopeptide (TPR) repeat protein
MSRNPYDFTKPVKNSKYFSGRKTELKEINNYLDLATGEDPSFYNMSIIGHRASGKTSFLNVIENTCNEKNLLPIKIALNNEIVQNETLLFREMFDGIFTHGADKGMYGGLKDKIYQNFRKAVDSLTIEAEIPLWFCKAYVGLKDSKSPSFPQQVLRHDLEELYKEAKKHGINGVVLLFDECDLFAKNETLLQKIRNVFEDIDGYILVFAGTEKMFPSIEQIFSPIPRFFKRINVGNFKELKDTEDCLLDPLTDEERKKFDRNCVQDIHNITVGAPYEIKLIAHHMYQRWSEDKSKNIGLSTKVLDDVLNEIERLRGTNIGIINKIKRYWPEHLKTLIGLLEFPNVSYEWLAEYLLLDEFETIQLKDIHMKKSITKDYVKTLLSDGLISEHGKLLNLKMDSFGLLYLKYYCASKGIRELRDFSLQTVSDPIADIAQKFTEKIFLKQYADYETVTLLDTGTYDKEKGNSFILGLKANIPPGKTIKTIFEMPKTQNEFYEGVPNSVRFRVNISWMNQGFVTQVKFNNLSDAERLNSILKANISKLDTLGYKIHTQDENYWNVEGTKFSSKGDHHGAIKCYDKAIQLNPRFELPYANKARNLLALKKSGKALESINKTLELHSSWSEAWRIKGMALLQMQRNPEALDALDKALKYNPEDADAWDNKGRVQLNLKQYANAVISFNKCLEYRSNNQALLYQGICFSRLNRHKQALENFELVLKDEPENFIALHEIASILFNKKQFIDALHTMEKIKPPNSNNVQIIRFKSMICGSLKNYDEALTYCNQIIEKNPKDGIAYYDRACYNALKGNIDNAIADLKHSFQLQPDFKKSAKKEKDFKSLENNNSFKELLSSK